MIVPNDTFKNHPDVVVTELDDKEAVLLHLETKNYYTLNDTGARIWQLLCSGLSISEIIKKIDSEYEMTFKSSKESILKLIQDLLDEKLLTRI
jgi:hypothetical protein